MTYPEAHTENIRIGMRERRDKLVGSGYDPRCLSCELVLNLGRFWRVRIIELWVLHTASGACRLDGFYATGDVLC